MLYPTDNYKLKIGSHIWYVDPTLMYTNKGRALVEFKVTDMCHENGNTYLTVESIADGYGNKRIHFINLSENNLEYYYNEEEAKTYIKSYSVGCSYAYGVCSSPSELHIRDKEALFDLMDEWIKDRALSTCQDSNSPFILVYKP